MYVYTFMQPRCLNFGPYRDMGVESLCNGIRDLFATSNGNLGGTISITLSLSNYYLVIKLICSLAAW